MKEKLFKKGLGRRLFSVVLALAMVVALMPINTLTVKAAEPNQIGTSSTYWQLEEGTLTISGTGAMPDDGLGSSAPWYLITWGGDTDISLTIGSDITAIGVDSFYAGGCIKSVSIAENSKLTAINEYAFNRCGMTSINLPETLTSIGNNAFRACKDLKNVTVNATTPPALGTNVFNDCHSDLKIYVPASKVDEYKAASGWSNYADKIVAIPHSHSFTYTADENVLTATCANTDGGCGLTDGKVTLTLTATSPNYSGSSESPVSFESIDAWTDAGLTLPDIYYEGTGTTTYSKSTTAPTAWGTYEASITMYHATAKVVFSISEKMNEIASSVNVDVPVYAQVAATAGKYNVRFVYAIDKDDVENISEVGLVCDYVDGGKQIMHGTDIFSTIYADSTPISDPDKYYAVFEITNVEVGATFNVNTIVWDNDSTPTEGSTVYSYTLN